MYRSKVLRNRVNNLQNRTTQQPTLTPNFVVSNRKKVEHILFMIGSNYLGTEQKVNNCYLSMLNFQKVLQSKVNYDHTFIHTDCDSNVLGGKANDIKDTLAKIVDITGNLTVRYIIHFYFCGLGSNGIVTSDLSFIPLVDFNTLFLSQLKSNTTIVGIVDAVGNDALLKTNTDANMVQLSSPFQTLGSFTSKLLENLEPGVSVRSLSTSVGTSLFCSNFDLQNITFF